MCQENACTDQTPLVSVIVPVYNVEAYLKRCLHSLCTQTYQNIEILLVDDGSTDGSGAICDEFHEKDARIKVFHQKNAGVSCARNKGLDEAIGTYLSFVDSDDFVMPEFLETMMTIMQESGGDIVQVGGLSLYDEAVEASPAVLQKAGVSPGYITMSGKDVCLGLLESTLSGCGVVWNKLYNAALFCNLRFPEREISEDNAVVYRLYWAAHTVAINNSRLYVYQYFRSGSLTNQEYSLKNLAGVESKKEQYEFYASVGDQKLCEKAKAEFVRESMRHIQKLKASDIENRKNICSQLYLNAIHTFWECLPSKNLSLRSKVGMMLRLLGLMEK